MGLYSIRRVRFIRYKPFVKKYSYSRQEMGIIHETTSYVEDLVKSCATCRDPEELQALFYEARYVSQLFDTFKKNIENILPPYARLQ
ncbi:MAG: hypothetical protein Sylvanvirus2_2 [Sylvanvirus sp.]|uniref:Uncharacterized protein n=1 Tax=Sylvanvirus sp. TaxID=2487774 RepID=A0A3G5AH10_9VIRU|nr:MAG: hypothetical protein Sylvanvirus2_2 [Sylvanvirus sp.]